MAKGRPAAGDEGLSEGAKFLEMSKWMVVSRRSTWKQ
jgi:hypothetical protein